MDAYIQLHLTYTYENAIKFLHFIQTGDYDYVSVFDQCLIDVLLPGVFQDVKETQVDSVRLFNDDVQQRLSGFD